MSNNRKNGRMVVLGALLLLAATASGCGVGLPTQPDVDSNDVQGRSATAAGASEDSPFEFGDGTFSGSTGEDVVPGEVEIPTPSGPGSNGLAKGPQKEKWMHRHGG